VRLCRRPRVAHTLRLMYTAMCLPGMLLACCNNKTPLPLGMLVAASLSLDAVMLPIIASLRLS
jgi:hypothetical protein